MRPAPVSRLVTVTVAPGRAAPEESSTLPETDAVTCALIVPTAKQMLKRTPAKACVDNFLSESILHPSPFGRNSLEELYSPLHCLLVDTRGPVAYGSAQRKSSNRKFRLW